jgi:hypothetical protein
VLGKGRVVAEFTSENISRDVIVEAMVGYSDVESQLGPEPVAGTAAT